jgi:hypothetical protein
MTFLQTSTTRKSLIPAYLSPGNGGGPPLQRHGETSSTQSPTGQRIRNGLVPITSTIRGRRATWTKKEERRSIMFLILAVVLVLLWLGGFVVLHVSSFLIHLLLLFAVISIIMNFVGGRRAV